jgi:hypothetical protein
VLLRGRCLSVSARTQPQELNGAGASGRGRDTVTPRPGKGGWNLRELARPEQVAEHAVRVSLLVPALLPELAQVRQELEPGRVGLVSLPGLAWVHPVPVLSRKVMSTRFLRVGPRPIMAVIGAPA